MRGDTVAVRDRSLIKHRVGSTRYYSIYRLQIEICTIVLNTEYSFPDPWTAIEFSADLLKSPITNVFDPGLFSPKAPSPSPSPGRLSSASLWRGTLQGLANRGRCGHRNPPFFPGSRLTVLVRNQEDWSEPVFQVLCLGRAYYQVPGSQDLPLTGYISSVLAYITKQIHLLLFFPQLTRPQPSLLTCRTSRNHESA